MDVNAVVRFALFVIVSYLAVRWLVTLMIIAVRQNRPGKAGRDLPHEGDPSTNAASQEK